MTRINQTAEELQVFRHFSKHYPGGLSDIEHRDPPEPDIRAKNHQGKQMAFEIVEFVDQEFARVGYGTFDLKPKFDKAYQMLALSEREQLQSTLANSGVFIGYHENSSMRDRQKTIPDVFKLLRTLPPKESGEYTTRTGDFESDVIRSIRIYKASFDGPQWWPSAAGHFSDPTIGRLAEKFSKRYTTNAESIELLGFFHLQPGPFRHLFGEIKDFVETNKKQSAFSAVWIYSENSDKIIMTI